MHDDKIFQRTNIDGCFLIKPGNIFRDFRGYYFESYNEKYYTNNLGIKFVQDDFSKSRYSVIRGFHGDFNTFKLISCPHGEIWVNICDPRDPSDSKIFSILLSDENLFQVLVPPGCGTGFQVLTSDAIFHYKQSTYYDRASQFTIKFDDPRFNAFWPINNPIISERDKNVG